MITDDIQLPNPQGVGFYGTGINILLLLKRKRTMKKKRQRLNKK